MLSAEVTRQSGRSGLELALNPRPDRSKPCKSNEGPGSGSNLRSPNDGAIYSQHTSKEGRAEAYALSAKENAAAQDPRLCTGVRNPDIMNHPPPPLPSLTCPGSSPQSHQDNPARGVFSCCTHSRDLMITPSLNMFCPS